MKTKAPGSLRFFPGYFNAPRNYQRKGKNRLAMTACHPTFRSWMNPQNLFDL
ncbi:MAG: hypothetical protein JXR71_06675 [Bacteroidales bacterium]|nr:hypothetical protein [Bacteroidales bacterium]